ncbi:MAG: hypothetical protein SF070_05080 [Gemmatimonadota bacterium]|nr:hypothetical protein [Gemmatimonadota bacterium]
MRTMILAAAVLATACGPRQVGAPAPKQGEPAAVSVRTVLTTQALVGQTVLVSGYCLPAATPAKAHGTQPVRRSDWQLEEHGVAVWVNGPKPAECSAATEARSTITATVAQDTIPEFGRVRQLRPYLVAR